jgi:hypothetical protein
MLLVALVATRVGQMALRAPQILGTVAGVAQVELVQQGEMEVQVLLLFPI